MLVRVGWTLNGGSRRTSRILLWCLCRCPKVRPNGFSSVLAFAGWGLEMRPFPQFLG